MKNFEPSPHLHIIREMVPEGGRTHHVNQVFCVSCQKPVWIVCVDRPPIGEVGVR